MNLTWLELLLIYLGASLILYVITPKKYRYIALLIVSLVAYILYSKWMAIFLGITALTTYLSGIFLLKSDERYQKETVLIEREQKEPFKKSNAKRKTGILLLFLFINLGSLFVLKYFGFITNSITAIFKVAFPSWFNAVMPLGMSYYTLDAISYVVDVKEKKIDAEKNFLKVAVFLCYFPKTSEGPFERYDELAPQLLSGKKIDPSLFFSGMLLSSWGFFKIVIVANRIAPYTSEIFKNYNSYSGIFIVLGAILFTVQLYADFSGAIDAARGISRMFGIELAQNFDLPFISEDVGEFWRRWHISLGRWFKDYIFYPLTMSKASKAIHKKLTPKIADNISIIIALFVVWLLTGIWHGATIKYVIYGLYYFVLIVIHMALSPLENRLLEKMKINRNNWVMKMIKIIFTSILVVIGMMLFRAVDLHAFVMMIESIFLPSSGWIKIASVYNQKELIPLLIGLVLIILSGVLGIFKKKPMELAISSPLPVKISLAFVFIMFIIVFGAYGHGYLPPDPIYGGF